MKMHSMKIVNLPKPTAMFAITLLLEVVLDVATMDMV